MPKVVAMEMHCMRQQPEAMKRWCGWRCRWQCLKRRVWNARCASSAEGHGTAVRLLLREWCGYQPSGGENDKCTPCRISWRSREGGAAVTRKGCRYLTLRIQFT